MALFDERIKMISTTSKDELKQIGPYRVLVLNCFRYLTRDNKPRHHEAGRILFFIFFFVWLTFITGGVTGGGSVGQCARVSPGSACW